MVIPRKEFSPKMKQKFDLPANEDVRRTTLKMHKFLCPYNDKNLVRDFMEFNQETDSWKKVANFVLHQDFKRILNVSPSQIKNYCLRKPTNKVSNKANYRKSSVIWMKNQSILKNIKICY